jgi:hypothetical protein
MKKDKMEIFTKVFKPSSQLTTKERNASNGENHLGKKFL